MSELKPCPFCGGEAKGVRAAKAYHVYCTCCGADVMASTMKAMTTCQVNKQKFKAEKKWNQRAETETEKRLTAIATKHATRADELWETLETVTLVLEGKTEFHQDEISIESVRSVLEKSRIEAEEGL